MKLFISVLLTVSVALLTACAGAQPEAEKPVEAILAEKDLAIVEELDRLTAFNINSWQYVNENNVILVEGASRRYLVETRNSCPELQWAQRIAFTSFGRTIQKNSDRILVTDSGGHLIRCTIRTFYSLEKIGD